MMYSRPILCRLCEFPVLDTGVRVAELDLQRLGRWWLRELGTEFDDDPATIESSWICRFCVGDARFKNEMEARTAKNDSDWWRIENPPQQQFCEYGVIQPCRVTIRPLQSITCQEYSPSNNVVESGPEKNEQAPPLKFLRSADCIYCDNSFPSRLEAHRHALTEHRAERLIFCSQCRLHFKSQDDLLTHKKNFHNPLKCHACSENVINPSDLWDHISSKHQKKKTNTVTCCGMLFKRRLDLDKHMNPTKTFYRQCVYCTKSFRVSKMKAHVTRYHADRKIKCDYLCAAYFLSSEEKRQHVLNVHENKSGLFKCAYCPCKYNKYNLRRHVASVHSIQVMKCKFRGCESYFHTKEDCDKHFKDVHLSSKVVENVKCVYCDEIISRSSVMPKHVAFKHKKIMIQCKVRGCKQFFLNADDLRRHVCDKRLENDKKTLKCEKCVFRTHSTMSLKIHKLVQHGNQSLQCAKCPKVLKSTLALRQHDYKLHRSAAEEACSHCNRRFKHITRHLVVHPCVKCKCVMPCKTLTALHKKSCQIQNN